MRRHPVLGSCLWACIAGAVVLGAPPAVSAERGTGAPAATPRGTGEMTPPASAAPTSPPALTSEEQRARVLFYAREGFLCVPVLLLLAGGVILAHKIGGRAGRVQMLGILLAVLFVAADWVLKDPHLNLLKEVSGEWRRHWETAFPVGLLVAAYVFAAGFLAVACRAKSSPPKLPSPPS